MVSSPGFKPKPDGDGVTIALSLPHPKRTTFCMTRCWKPLEANMRNSDAPFLRRTDGVEPMQEICPKSALCLHPFDNAGRTVDGCRDDAPNSCGVERGLA